MFPSSSAGTTGRLLRRAVIVIASAVTFVACGSSDPADDADAVETTIAGEQSTTSVEVAEPADPVDVPVRIVSLSPTHTEILFAIGAGDQVIAVDEFSYYPPEALDKVTTLSGFEPNVEAIVEYEPDLVVTEGTNPTLLEQLGSLGIPTYAGLAATSFDEVFDQITELGDLTGHRVEADQLVQSMQSDIDAITADLPVLDEPLTYYHELDPTLYSVTSDTFVGFMYSQLGLRSIADRAEGDGGSYPQLNAEFIIDADPDLIFLACTKYCGETAESVAARPGWDGLEAVQGGYVFEMDDDIASRWGPRVVEYYRSVAEAIANVVEGREAA